MYEEIRTSGRNIDYIEIVRLRETGLRHSLTPRGHF